MRKLDVYKLVKELNKLCKQLVEVYNINHGGCCFVASEIAKHFDRLGLKYELGIYDDCEKDLAAINEEVRNKCVNSLNTCSVVSCNSCCHYFLWLEDAGAINQNAEIFGDYSIYSISNIRHTNIKWIYKISIWNDEYSTSNNQAIKKIINSYFKPYECSY